MPEKGDPEPSPGGAAQERRHAVARREGAVDVEQERCLFGRFAKRGQQVHRTRIRA